MLGMIRRPGRIVGGAIRFGGVDLLRLSEDQMRTYRGRRIAMIPQSPRTALNPVISVGRQISRLVEIHEGRSRAFAQRRTIELLDLVGVSDPEGRAKQYAHQLSGGMCQRVMIAMALATSPELLIADEPTTGLDVSIAARILDLLRELGARTGAAIILITHDLGVVAETCGRVAVMHAGQLVEAAPVRELFHSPAHPYTRALVRSIPRIDVDVKLEPIPGSVPSLRHPPPGCRYQNRCADVMQVCRLRKPDAFVAGAPIRLPASPSRRAMTPLLEVSRLRKAFALSGPRTWAARLRGERPAVRAVDGVSLSIAAGETLGLVGEFGLRQVHRRPLRDEAG